MAALCELYGLAMRIASDLGRPITVMDVIFSADGDDRTRRLRLVRKLRSGR